MKRAWREILSGLFSFWRSMDSRLWRGLNGRIIGYILGNNFQDFPELKKWTDKIIGQFKSQKVNIIQFPAEDRAKWASKVEDIPAEWADEVTKQGYPGWKIVERYQQVCSELGYKWSKKWGIKK